MPTREPIPYVGRFAPSPTGPLHFGSLVAATASYLQARANSGQWLLRIEDIDPPREQAGASSQIVHALERYGFEWDGDVLFQSTRHEAHSAAAASLIDKNFAYRCRCSRSDLVNAQRGELGTIYPGTCRGGCDAGESAIRIRTNDSEIAFIDALQGRVAQCLETGSGDFIIRRRDGLIAYHLAVVVDDEVQGVTEVVRGIDLLDSTPRQIWLQRSLAFRTPNYAHIPVITHPNGDKLSKLTGAAGIPMNRVTGTLVDALTALQLSPPKTLARDSVSNVWLWAIENWQLGKLSGQKAIVKTA
ncbi:MAG: tRNA glutamyl-Q(34) synthetase GluQRS [Woeseiaceae bacterium]|nr:tRNA glutamyl-Q(34) synthetase GluQRS [Woeseiaceae bacterium]